MANVEQRLGSEPVGSQSFNGKRRAAPGIRGLVWA